MVPILSLLTLSWDMRPAISILLGHASIETTMRYLNLELDLQTTVSDFVPYERASLGKNNKGPCAGHHLPFVYPNLPQHLTQHRCSL
ncbi:MAG: hypothetical protein KJ069_27560 [Anaerolineae bacterium]|nr:hypothetical protein [Anaerolineae bacterium]